MHDLSAVAIIEPDNVWSRAVAIRSGFVDHGVQSVLDKPNHWFERPCPPTSYTDGVVTIRPPRSADAEAHTAAVDDVQIDWLWEPWQRGDWESKTPAEQLDHQRRFLQRTADEWGTGPKWWFVIEHDGEYAGHVDADLANPNVPHGEANISYSMRPDRRGRGLTSRAARLALQFVREHTGARAAHVLVHPDNEASLRVARSVGALETERTADGMVRHVLSLRG
jgi:RimJ/RimL family protein N-acetyltransferase